MKQLCILFIPFLLLAQSYTFSGNKDNVAQATAALILKKAYAKAKIPINIVSFPLEESLQKSNSGQSDGEISRIKTITQRYPNLRIVPVPLVHVEAAAFSKDTSIKITRWRDLKDYNFTIVKGAKFIEKATKGMDKEIALTFKEAFDRLKKQQTELVVIPKNAAISLSLQAQYKDIKKVSCVLEKLQLFHFVHKKNTHLIPLITPILKQMKSSGEIEYFRRSYLKRLTQ